MLANNVHMHSNALERERIELQIRAVVVPFRIERELRDQDVRKDFRRRARELLDHLDAAVGPYPDLQEALGAARVELGLVAKPI